MVSPGGLEPPRHDQLTWNEPMDEVSQNGRPMRRPWTAREQTTLEIAAACGASFAKIGAVLNRTPGVLHRKIGIGMEQRAKNPNKATGRRPWTSQDQITLEVAAACGVALNRLAALWNRSESHISAKLSHQRRKARNQSSRDWRANNQDHYLQYARKYSHKWKQANPEKAKHAARCHYQANKTKVLRQAAEWRRANLDRKKAIDKAWYAANREHCAARSKMYYQNNKKIIDKKQNLWKQRNIDKVRAIARRHSARRRARQKPLVPVTRLCVSLLRLNWQNRCAYCGKQKALTDDHVLPVVLGGLDELGNLVPACGSCNSSKQHKPVESWYRAQTFFTKARWRKIQRHCPAAVMGQLALGFSS